MESPAAVAAVSVLEGHADAVDCGKPQQGGHMSGLPGASVQPHTIVLPMLRLVPADWSSLHLHVSQAIKLAEVQRRKTFVHGKGVMVPIKSTKVSGSTGEGRPQLRHVEFGAQVMKGDLSMWSMSGSAGRNGKAGRERYGKPEICGTQGKIEMSEKQIGNIENSLCLNNKSWVGGFAGTAAVCISNIC